MPEKVLKITTGFVIQTYVGSQCVSQEFIAGDVVYEDENGNPVSVDTAKEEYYSFEMVQPQN